MEEYWEYVVQNMYVCLFGLLVFPVLFIFDMIRSNYEFNRNISLDVVYVHDLSKFLKMKQRGIGKKWWIMQFSLGFPVVVSRLRKKSDQNKNGEIVMQ